MKDRVLRVLGQEGLLVIPPAVAGVQEPRQATVGAMAEYEPADD
jgi:hypothetical protein